MSHIAQAVAPLKQQAQDRAELAMTQRIEEAYKTLEAAAWDLDKVAPIPNSGCGRAAYKQAQALREFYSSVTTYTKPTRMMHEPNTRQAAPAAVARMIQRARDEAAGSFEAFVAKLETKVGEHSAATLHGSSVWGYSVLDVVTPAGPQRWVTQQIINVSVLGKLFNQWPTRLKK